MYAARRKEDVPARSSPDWSPSRTVTVVFGRIGLGWSFGVEVFGVFESFATCFLRRVSCTAALVTESSISVHAERYAAEMAEVYVFADEAGDFAFNRAPSSSRYFILTTVTMGDCSIGMELLDLRRSLALRGGFVLSEFHATNDKQRVRDLVYDAMQRASIRIDATILDKTKTQNHLRADHLRFYKEAWFLHFKYVAPQVASATDELLVVASSLQIRRKKQAIHWAVRDVVNQVSPTMFYSTAFWSAVSDPCLQIADYAAWAIQRKYESGDDRSFRLIAPLVKSEFQPFLSGPTTYY